MQSKILLKWSLLKISIAGIALFSIVIIFQFFILSHQNSYTILVLPASGQNSQDLIDNNSIKSIAIPVQERSPLPIRLKIPRINVDAAIEYVGLTSGGAMDIPKDSANAAWFDIGSRPGENGSAVIAGHYGIKDGKPSVFDELYKLRKGDKVYIEDEKGVIVTFVVRENRRYDENADASGVFASKDGKPHLNLITCEGTWNEVSKSYSTRLVVFTDKE